MSRRNSRQSGFTLLELIVASTIMAIAITGILAALSTTMRNAAKVTDYDRAALLARRKMDELLVDRKLPKATPIEGQWDPSLTNGQVAGWRARVMPWEWTENAAAGGSLLERVELEIWWQTGDQRRTFNIEGFRRALISQADVDAGRLVKKDQ